MHNKKIIAKGLIVSILLFNTPIDSIADVVENYKITVVDEEDANYFKENKFEEFFNNLFNKFKKPKEVIKVNKNVVVGTVLEISLSNGQFVPNLNGNPNGYETIRVTTAGSKELKKQDYDNLRTSGIPKIDLSNAYSEIIPSGAFTDATHLTEFKFPKGLREIGDSTTSTDGAFKNCINLTGDLIIPDGVHTIFAEAFQNCTGFNGNLILPDSLTHISRGAFVNCSGFTGNLNLPNSITFIGMSAFLGCSSFTGDLILPNSVGIINSFAFQDCTGFDGKLAIPNSVTEIYSGAFKGCFNLKGNLVIPNSIETIKGGVFEGCSGFTGDLIIPDSVKSIEVDAFNGCAGFNGNLIIPNSVEVLGIRIFKDCSNLTGDIIIPNSVRTIYEDTFLGVDKVDRFIIKVNEDDIESNYKEEMISNLPDTTKTVIDLPYDFDITSTWLENTKRTTGKPIIKNIVDGEELDINNGEIGKKVSLHILAAYEEEKVIVLKDNKPYRLPIKNEEKHIFIEDGTYEVNITTTLGNVSNITFTVESTDYTDIEEVIDRAETSKNPVDIEEARDLVNALPESIKKDEFQGMLDAIAPELEFEIKNATSNLDIYIKSKNMISMSLDTNSVVFDNFSGVEDMEKLSAINITVNSSLPYELNAYLPTEIQNSDKSETMNKEILNIRENSEGSYKTFINTTDKLILKDNNTQGNNILHNIDLKLKGNIAYKNDVYKAIIKFEVQQK